MSFLKNLRNSVSRKHNSADKTSLSRNSELSDSTRRNSRSVIFSSRKEDEEEQIGDGLVRSETFTIDNHESIFVRNQETTRGSMFGRFSTFTKRKKGAKQKDEEIKMKDENLSSSYKRYPTPSDVVSSRNDPFHYLYERGSPNTVRENENQKKSSSSERTSIDYGTYRKNKLPGYIKEQLEEEQTNLDQPKSRYSSESRRSKGKVEEEEEEDKYKTVTINSFRKSFRERFLQQQRDVPYNPAWFVEVDAPNLNDKENEDEQNRRKDLLVFENEQYRPTAQSPIRNEYKSPTRTSRRSPTRQIDESPTRKSRSPGRSSAQLFKQHQQHPTRSDRSPTNRSSEQSYIRSSTHSSDRQLDQSKSPDRSRPRSIAYVKSSNHTDHHSPKRSSRQSHHVSANDSTIRQLDRLHSSPSRSQQPRSRVNIKRNETFRIERENNEPSIRIEIKNSITPNEPGRIVPVGVAKPIQSPNQNGTSKIIQRRWTEQGRDPSMQHNLYQTCIQLTNTKDIPNRSTRRDRNTNDEIYETSRSNRKIDSSNPVITNYSPLKSYELLSNIKQRNEVVIPSTGGGHRDKSRVFQQIKNPVIPQSYDGKKWIQTPTFSNQQKYSSSHTTDKSVRKDAINNRINAVNPRRFQTRTPWR